MAFNAVARVVYLDGIRLDVVRAGRVPTSLMATFGA